MEEICSIKKPHQSIWENVFLITLQETTELLSQSLLIYSRTFAGYQLRNRITHA